MEKCKIFTIIQNIQKLNILMNNEVINLTDTSLSSDNDILSENELSFSREYKIKNPKSIPKNTSNNINNESNINQINIKNELNENKSINQSIDENENNNNDVFNISDFSPLPLSSRLEKYKKRDEESFSDMVEDEITCSSKEFLGKTNKNPVYIDDTSKTDEIVCESKDNEIIEKTPKKKGRKRKGNDESQSPPKNSPPKSTINTPKKRRRKNDDDDDEYVTKKRTTDEEFDYSEMKHETCPDYTKYDIESLQNIAKEYGMKISLPRRIYEVKFVEIWNYLHKKR